MQVRADLPAKFTNMELKNLMYKIMVEKQMVLTSKVLERCKNTIDVFDYNCGYSSKDTR